MEKVTLQCLNKDGSVAVFCSQKNILKFWNTFLCSLEHEYQNPKYQMSCLEFCKVDKPNTNSKQKKIQQELLAIGTEEGTIVKPNTNSKKKKLQQELLAIGTKEGTIVVYNYTKRQATSKLLHSHESPVIDLSWKSSDKLITLGEDKKLILWNIRSGEIIHKLDIKGKSRVCSLGQGQFYYAVAGIGITYFKYRPAKKVTTKFKLADHKSKVQQLTPILFKNDTEARYVVSVAENDRFLYAWATYGKQFDSIATCNVGGVVKGFCYTATSESTIAIATWTQKGELKYFVQHLNGSASQKNDKHPSSTLIIRSSSVHSRTLPIIGAEFISTKVLLIIYGNQGLPQFETIIIKNHKGDLKYIRKDPGSLDKKKLSLVQILTPAVPADATYLMPHQFTSALGAKPMSNNKKRKIEYASELPMEARFDSLSITQYIVGMPKGTPLDNCVHRLVQALHSKDSVLLNSVLLKGEENNEVISSTVRKLPVSCVVPFIQCLQEIIVSKGIKTVSLINWIKAVFEHHMSLLSSVPNKEELLSCFYTVCNSRLCVVSTVSQLHSRIHLLLSHVKNRQDLSNGDHVHEALCVYKDGESSDDDDDLALGMSGMPSESEDTWDYLSDEERQHGDDDIEMVNGFNDDDEVVPVTNERSHQQMDDQHDDIVCGDDD